MNRREQIRKNLLKLYGEKTGTANYTYLMDALKGAAAGTTGGEALYSRLAGKVFAISYPDNVYNDTDPTLKTLGKTLAEHFPAVNGLHILPERVISHDDLWPQDLLAVLPADLATGFVGHLTRAGVLSDDRVLSRGIGEEELKTQILYWYEEHSSSIGVKKEQFLKEVTGILDSRRKAHFNDGGFSQITRARVDPRFGDVDDLNRLSDKYALMLDFVVNHLDIDNEILEAYRRGENDGSAFIVVSPEEYRRLKSGGEISKTFRPRPFPLFTGLRKYPRGGGESSAQTIERMSSVFEKAGLTIPDIRVTRFLSIYFKMQNDQGLSAEDRATVDSFIAYLSEVGGDPDTLFCESEIQEGQPALKPDAAAGMAECCEIAGVGREYAEVFLLNDDEIFGEKVFVYTTFSESQVDINPVSQAGFRLIFDDLLHILGSGNLTMMRMDAVKYLWKEIGKKNFDMVEGDILIEVIRLFLSLAAPEMVPLDEVNSSDQDVYRMGSEGGFYYLFGQVNALPAAFNSGSLRPIDRMISTMKSQCPENLLLFVTLSTHDGRSIQGIGVDRSDGHVSIGEFSDLRKISEEAGGKVKYRSVPTGRIPADTFRKACGEMGSDPARLEGLFKQDGDAFSMIDKNLDRAELIESLSQATGNTIEDADFNAAAGYLADWVIDGRAPYEMCCTSRAAFSRAASPEEEARRLALAQIFILSFGQSVPAIYFNDLLGLGNDLAGFARSGRPRDLNRHKNRVDEIERSLTGDRFTQEYTALLNAAIKARTEDPAFCPGSRGYEYISLSDSVFLNHLYVDTHHSLIMGNITPNTTGVKVDLSAIEHIDGITAFTDRLTGKGYSAAGNDLEVELPGYGGLWLSSGG